MQITAKKSLGQNFLVNPHILDKIVSAAEISQEDTVLEIGPGTGNLTKKIAEKAGQLIALEKDHRLIPPLKDMFNADPKVEIIEADILKFKPENFNLTTGSYKIVANIPYYLTSNLIRTVFESDDWQTARPKLIVLTIQKEVAQRIIAKPPHMNLLALSVQYYSKPEVIGYISKNNFRPIPKIDSAIIRLTPNDQKMTEETKKLFKLIGAGFSEKRKQLASNISKKLKIPRDNITDILKKNDLNEKIRAENLTLTDWKKLNKALFN